MANLAHLVQVFGIPPSLLEKSRSEGDSVYLDQIYQDCVKNRARFAIEVDSSPVMASSDSFAAKIDHGSRTITLNGFLLAQSGDSEVVREFLIFHELAHEFVRAPLPHLDLDEEETCDLVALYALQKIEN